MKIRIALSFVFILCCSLTNAFAQDATQGPAGDVRASEPRVPLTAEASGYDIAGRVALVGRLRTTTLAGSPDAPERNVRVVIENRGAVFYTYATGWATFYGGDNVRCGEGMWKLEALAPGEMAEVDTPGLRLTCQPTTWRIVATNLLTRTTDAAKPPDQTAPPPTDTPAPASPSSPPSAAALPPLEININGKTLPIQPGNPLEVVVGKERVRLILQPAP
jgi:hypothetical protein